MFEFRVPFIIDPRTKEPSVSLSMLVISFLGVLIASGLEMSGKVENTSILMEAFYASAGLYWGRKFQGKSGNNIETETKA
jgi:hypothetical protein